MNPIEITSLSLKSPDTGSRNAVVSSTSELFRSTLSDAEKRYQDGKSDPIARNGRETDVVDQRESVKERHQVTREREEPHSDKPVGEKEEQGSSASDVNENNQSGAEKESSAPEKKGHEEAQEDIERVDISAQSNDPVNEPTKEPAGNILPSQGQPTADQLENVSLEADSDLALEPEEQAELQSDQEAAVLDATLKNAASNGSATTAGNVETKNVTGEGADENLRWILAQLPTTKPGTTTTVIDSSIVADQGISSENKIVQALATSNISESIVKSSIGGEGTPGSEQALSDELLIKENIAKQLNKSMVEATPDGDATSAELLESGKNNGLKELNLEPELTKDGDELKKTARMESLLSSASQFSSSSDSNKGQAFSNYYQPQSAVSSQVNSGVAQNANQLSMSVPPNHPNWGNEMGEKVVWMSRQGVQSAEIKLDPPELGSLVVKVKVEHDSASVSFVAATPQVRELLEGQINRLREMLAQQGMDLDSVDVNVAERDSGQTGHPNGEEGSSSTLSGGSDIDDGELDDLISDSSRVSVIEPGRVDYFA